MFRRVVPVVVSLLLASSALAAGPAPEQAFGQLKALAGNWGGKVAGMDAPVTVGWKVTAGGSAVMETLFQGTPHEMVSVYFMDKGVLRMTHYCAAGNQPRMRYDAAKSTDKELAFVFDGGTNFNPKKDMHIHEGRVVIDGDSLKESWAGWNEGKQADVKAFDLARQ